LDLSMADRGKGVLVSAKVARIDVEPRNASERSQLDDCPA
jgi:hypothetical protein